MKIGFVGLGKLGLPVAVSMALKGHDVMGYDIDPNRMTHEPQGYQETGPDGTGDFNDWLAESTINFGSLQEVVDHGDIVFVAVQTPHDPKYEGITPLPEDRVDFDYTYLIESIKNIAACVDKKTVIAVISTVLPGTMRKHIMPLLNDNCHLVYNPSFIAMGTTMRDFIDPEFVLLGIEDPIGKETIDRFYDITIGAKRKVMSIESAELAKVAYNTYITFKIAFSNIIMETCQKIKGADCDEVMGALKCAHRRLISPTYLDGGMGDGGGCHPRDNIAMSWLAREHCLSFDIFEAMMKCREAQAVYLANMLEFYSKTARLPIVILGYAFKPGTNITVGSHALLVKALLTGNCDIVDPVVNTEDNSYELEPAVYLIGCKHQEFIDYKFPEGSIVIDPHRYIRNQKDVNVIRLGERMGL